MPVTITVKLNKLPGMDARTRQAVTRAVAASGMRANAKQKQRSRVDTGFHRSSLQVQASGLTATLTSNSGYGLYLDQGTRRMSADRHFSGPMDEERTLFPQEIERAVKAGTS